MRMFACMNKKTVSSDLTGDGVMIVFILHTVYMFQIVKK